MWLSRHYHADTTYEDDEYEEIVVSTLAVRLHKLPDEIRTMNQHDIWYVMAILKEDNNPDG